MAIKFAAKDQAKGAATAGGKANVEIDKPAAAPKAETPAPAGTDLFNAESKAPVKRKTR